MTRYVQLKGGRMLEVVRQTDKVLTGFRVNREGERITRVTKTHEQTFLDVTKPDRIVTELAINRKYGELEPLDFKNPEQLIDRERFPKGTVWYDKKGVE